MSINKAFYSNNNFNNNNNKKNIINKKNMILTKQFTIINLKIFCSYIYIVL